MPPDALQEPNLLDPLDIYLQQAEHELLTAAEEQTLARRIQGKTKGWKQARQKLREANLLLVVHIAARYAKFRLPFEDKVQEGNLALMRAVDGYQPGRFRFATYAGKIIEHGILRACREQSTVVRVPEHVHVSVHRGRRDAPAALEDFYPIFEDEISEEEERDEAEESVSRVHAFRERVRELLCVLTDREALIVTQRLGLDGKEPRQQKAIGRQLQLTAGGVCMAERIAIRKLLTAVGREFEPPPHDAQLGSYAALFRTLEASE